MCDFENQRNHELIKEREEYEKRSQENFKLEIEEFEKYYLGNVVENMLNSEEFDELMSDRIDFINNRYDFEQDIQYEDIDDFYYDYDVSEEFYDYPIGLNGEFIEGYDYPEGPNENLGGVYYHDPNEIYSDYELANDWYIDKLIEKSIAEHEKARKDPLYDLIKQRLKDEKNFLDSIVEEIIQEEYYVPKVIDEVLLENMSVDYDKNDFDYDSAPQYWYDNDNETIGEPIEKFDPNQVPEPPEVIAFTKQEEDKIKILIKDYIKKEEILDRIVKQKLKENKFK